jgi:hypothetical protein
VNLEHRHAAAAWALALVVGLGALGLAGSRAASAHAGASRSLARLEAARASAAEIARLRAAAPPWMAAGRPEAGLSQRLGAALQAAGLPAQALSGVQAQAEPAGPPELRAARLRAGVTLTGLTLPQVGRFLAAWREREPRWTASSVDLSPEPPRGGAGGAAARTGGDLPLRVAVTLECLFVDETGG